MSPIQRQRIRKLNILLAIPTEKSPNWTQLRKNLVYAVDDRKTVTSVHRATMTPKIMYSAMETLQSAVRDFRTIGKTTFALEAHNLSMYAAPGRPLLSRYDDPNYENAIIHAFHDLVEKLEIRADQFLNCAGFGCGRAFVPLRKPTGGKQAYCSILCARRVAVWNYRRRKREELKEKERIRSKRRYREQAKKAREEKERKRA